MQEIPTKQAGASREKRPTEKAQSHAQKDASMRREARLVTSVLLMTQACSRGDLRLAPRNGPLRYVPRAKRPLHQVPGPRPCRTVSNSISKLYIARIYRLAPPESSAL